MGQDDLEACAATLLLVGAEARRAGLDDVGQSPRNEGAAEIYRLLDRDDLAQVLSGGSAAPRRTAGRARTDRLKPAWRPRDPSSTRPRPGEPGLTAVSSPGPPGEITSRTVGGTAPFGGDDITRLLLLGS